jgi:hypothetical protein
MRPEPSTRLGWLRAVALGTITLMGILTIVGSGGGLGSVCDTYPDSCQPLPPLPSARITPDKVVVQVGASATFLVETANITGPVTYQWRRSANGGLDYTDIPNATSSSLTLPAVNLADDNTVVKVVIRQGNGQLLEPTARLAVSASPGVVFEDTSFETADWQGVPVLLGGSPPFTHVEERIATGGLPGAYRRMTDQIAPGSGLSYMTHLQLPTAYDPRNQGAVRFIDFAQDCIVFTGSSLNYVESGPVLEQNGRSFVIDRNVPLCNSSSWTRVQRLALTAADFRQITGPACAVGETCPDFSLSALPLRMGYQRIAQTTPGGTVIHGIDNWRVTIWRR